MIYKGRMLPAAPTLAPILAARAHPDVHIGDDDWLFLTGGTNDVLAQYGEPGFPRDKLWRWRRILAARTFRFARMGIRYAHVVAPEKLAIYDHAAGDLSVDPGRAPSLRLERWLALSLGWRAWIDLVRPFRAGARRQALYRHTDSHWTFEGCLLAYREICHRLGVVPRDDIASRRDGAPMAFSGDLGLKFSPQRFELAEPCLFESAARRVHANDLVTTFEAMGRGRDAHIGAHVVFRNPSPQADPRRLVLFGDSYSHHTPNPCTGTLTPMLADTFAEVHMLWSTSIDWGYVARVRPDFVVSQIAERFMVDVPQTGFNIEKLSALALARKAT